MKRFLLAGLVMMVLGGGSVKGMDHKRVSATRKFDNPQPNDVVQAGITITTYKSNFLDKKIPDNFFNNKQELARKFGKCEKWNDAIEIIAADFENELKSPTAQKRTDEEFEAIFSKAQTAIDALLGIHYKKIDFYIDTPKDGRYGYPRQRKQETVATQYVKPTPKHGRTTPVAKNSGADSEKKRASLVAKESKKSESVVDEINELADGMGNLALTEAEMKKATAEDHKYIDDNEKKAIQAIRVEISDMRWMLKDLLDQRQSGTPEERVKAQAIIKGIEASYEGIKVAEIVTEKGIAGLVRLIVASDSGRRLVAELIPYAEDAKDPLKIKKNAKYVINGFLYFAQLLFKEKQNIRKIVKNNVEFIQVLAFMSLISKQKNWCGRSVLNLCCQSDPAYARNIFAACGKMQAILHPNAASAPKAGCCKSWCGCGSRNQQVAVAGASKQKTECCKGGCLSRCCSGAKTAGAASQKNVPKEKCTCRTFSWEALKVTACSVCITAAWALSEQMLTDNASWSLFS